MQLFIIDTFILEIAKITVINHWHITFILEIAKITVINHWHMTQIL